MYIISKTGQCMMISIFFKNIGFEFSDLSSLSHNVISCNILTVYCFFIFTDFLGVMKLLN